MLFLYRYNNIRRGLDIKQHELDLVKQRLAQTSHQQQEDEVQNIQKNITEEENKIQENKKICKEAEQKVQ